MQKLQFYKYSTWALLLLNLTMIAFFFITKPNPPHGKNFTEEAIKILKLDEQQQTVFLKSAEKHGQQTGTISNRQSELLKPYFNSLITPNEAADLDSLLNQVQHLEREKIEITYLHFQEVKALLKANQKADFETFMQKIQRIILLGGKKNPPPPKDF